MNVYSLLAAFGGGAFSVAIGGLPAFIFTGFFALIGGVMGMGGFFDPTLDYVAFGSWFGPHITFATGAAVAAIAAKKGDHESAMDTATPLWSLKSPKLLLIGGLYGMVAYIFFTLAVSQDVINTDFPGFIVTVMLVITRLIVGESGLFSKGDNGERVPVIPDGDTLLLFAVLGGTLGLVIGGVGVELEAAGLSPEQMGLYPIALFGMSAVKLFFLQTGFDVPVTHHITLPSATMYILTGSILGAVVVGMVNAIAWVVVNNLVNNKYSDTYIDAPAIVIFISITIITHGFGV